MSRAQSFEPLDRPPTEEGYADAAHSRSPGEPTPSGAARGRPGRVIAAVLVLALAFASGLVIGATGAPPPSAPAGAPPTRAAVASAVSTPGSAAPREPTPAPTSPMTNPATPSSPAGTSPTPGAPPSGSGSAAPATATPGPTALPSTSPAPSDSGPSAIASPGTPGDLPADFGLLDEALRLVGERFVDRAEVSDRELAHGAVRGMIEALGDTGHSVFLTPEELRSEQESLSGTLVGIGVVVGERDGRVTVLSVLPDTPADAAGVRPGDRILAVDDKRVDRLRPEDVTPLVRGEVGTTVVLTVVHAGETGPVEIPITRQRIEIDPVSWAFVPDSRTADIHLIQFSQGAGAAFGDSLREALDAGAQQLVIDLRGNPGGLVEEAVLIASQFLPEGTTVYIRRDAAGTETPVTARPGGLGLDIPLVVLVDEGTASSAEILSGALQGADRGPIVGVRTVGTGTVLNTFELSDGSAVRLGVEAWLTPDGRRIFEEGITPDVEVELPADALPLEPRDLETLTADDVRSSRDAPFVRALELLAEATAAPRSLR